MESKKNSTRHRIYSISSSFLVLMLFILLFANNVSSVLSDFKNRARAELDKTTDLIEFNLNKELSNVNVIKAFVKDSLEQYGYIDETRLNEYIKNVFQGDEDVDVITISPDAPYVIG